MSLRGVWIYKTDPKEAPQRILFTRRFPSAECHAKRQQDYAALPEENELCSAVFSACGLTERDDEFTRERDSCLVSDTQPLFEIGAKKHWPLVVIRRHTLLFCALPVVDCVTSSSRANAIEIPGVATAIDLLEQTAAYLGPSANSLDQADPQLNDLHNILSTAMPFGTPLRTELSQVAAMLASKPPPPSGKSKQAAWKPFPYKGNSKLALALQERVSSAQYDSAEVPDVIQVNGDIRCRAELETNPELSVGVSTPANAFPISYLVVHPCVQRSEAHPVPRISSPRSTSPVPAPATAHTRKMTLHPPPELFTLVRYNVDGPTLPIRGFYQMKGDKTVKLLVQLKLAAGIKNSFDFCELRLPFFNRGPVSNVEFLPSSAQVSIAPDHRTLIWNIGQKFPSRSLEISLNATITFQDDVPAVNGVTAEDGVKAEEFVEDPFCVGLNAYAELHFRILDYTLSGCHLDPKGISVYPNARYKLNLSRELVSDGYMIWNSHGDARVATMPPPPSQRA